MNWSAQESHDWRNWTKKPENVQSSTGFDPVLPSAIVKRTSKPHSRARQIFVFCLIFDEKYDHKCNKINHKSVTNVSTQVICDWRNCNRIKLLNCWLFTERITPNILMLPAYTRAEIVEIYLRSWLFLFKYWGLNWLNTELATKALFDKFPASAALRSKDVYVGK